MNSRLLLLADGAAFTLLAITVFLTRANVRRTIGALACGVAAATVKIGGDALAARMGWWHHRNAALPALRS